MLKFSKLTRWCTTPSELRRIADELERNWKKVKLGENVLRVVVDGREGDLHIILDQEAQYDEERKPPT